MARVIGRYGSKTNPRAPEPDVIVIPFGDNVTMTLKAPDEAAIDYANIERLMLARMSEAMAIPMSQLSETISELIVAGDTDGGDLRGLLVETGRRMGRSFASLGLNALTSSVTEEHQNRLARLREEAARMYVRESEYQGFDDPYRERRTRDARPNRITSVRQARGRRNDIPNPNRWGGR